MHLCHPPATFLIGFNTNINPINLLWHLLLITSLATIQVHDLSNLTLFFSFERVLCTDLSRFCRFYNQPSWCTMICFINNWALIIALSIDSTSGVSKYCSCFYERHFSCWFDESLNWTICDNTLSWHYFLIQTNLQKWNEREKTFWSLSQLFKC